MCSRGDLPRIRADMERRRKLHLVSEYSAQLFAQFTRAAESLATDLGVAVSELGYVFPAPTGAVVTIVRHVDTRRDARFERVSSAWFRWSDRAVMLPRLEGTTLAGVRLFPVQHAESPGSIYGVAQVPTSAEAWLDSHVRFFDSFHAPLLATDALVPDDAAAKAIANAGAAYLVSGGSSARPQEAKGLVLALLFVRVTSRTMEVRRRVLGWLFIVGTAQVMVPNREPHHFLPFVPIDFDEKTVRLPAFAIADSCAVSG